MAAIIAAFLLPAIISRPTAHNHSALQGASGELYLDPALQDKTIFEPYLDAWTALTFVDARSGLPPEVLSELPTDRDGQTRFRLPMLYVETRTGPLLVQGGPEVSHILSSVERMKAEAALPWKLALIVAGVGGAAWLLQDQLRPLLEGLPYIELIFALSLAGQVCDSCAGGSFSLRPGMIAAGLVVGTIVFSAFQRSAGRVQAIQAVAALAILGGQSYLQYIEPKFCILCATITVLATAQLVLSISHSPSEKLRLVRVPLVAQIGVGLIGLVLAFSALRPIAAEPKTIAVGDLAALTKSELAAQVGPLPTDIVVITLPGCEACDVLKTFLLVENIPYTELAEHGPRLASFDFERLGYPLILAFEPNGKLGFWQVGITSDPEDRDDLGDELRKFVAR